MLHESPRQRRYVATRERILQAAIQRIGAVGPDAVTLAAIADAVDLTPAALYRYFRSKEAILHDVGRVVASRWAAELAAAAGSAPPHPEPAVHALRRALALCAAWRAGILGDPLRAQIIGRVVGDPQALLPDDVALALVTPALEALQPLVQALAEAPLSPGDPLERAIALLAAQQGILSLAKLGRLTPIIDAGRLAATLPLALLRGWGASDTALSEACA